MTSSSRTTPQTTHRTSRSRDFAWIIIAYAVALLVAALVVYFSDATVLFKAGLADVLATLVIFAFSVMFANSSFYDAYWSIAPPVLLVYWAAALGVLDLRVAALGLLVGLWAVRLTHNWARGWQGLSHQDWRYDDLREKTGVWYPLVDLLGIQLLPTVLVFIGCVPVYLVLSAGSLAAVPWSWLDGVWIVVMLVLFLGISIPMIDKRQLANKPEYAQYKSQVWSLVPRFWSS